MRDGLSLLDQAIAFSDGAVTLAGVQSMLGVVDSSILVKLLRCLRDNDAAGMLSIADEMAMRSFSFRQALRDIASLLHRTAIAQRVPASISGDAEADSIRELAGAFTPDEVQLYYQIAINGRNDLHLAPDEYAGFTMTLLRMLAFKPAGSPVAARIANRPCIERLLKAGARKDLCNDHGQSPADMVRANKTTTDTKLADLLATNKCAK
jgi:DNA polymerase-3 subunit gamma/tau